MARDSPPPPPPPRLRHTPSRSLRPKRCAAPSSSAASDMLRSIRARPLSHALCALGAFVAVVAVAVFSTYCALRSRTPPHQLRLQMGLDYQRRLRRATESGRKPPSVRFLRWLHIPKTGTSLVNTLVRWGCTHIPDDLFVMPRRERPRGLTLSHNQTFSWDWLFSNASGREWLRNHCNHRLVTSHPTTNVAQYSLYIHKPLSTWEIPHAVAMFRIPRQRIYSNYLHISLHYNESNNLKESLYSFLHRSEFWSQHAKLLIGRTYRDKRLINEREALLAVNLVTNHLPFVGLTEQFRLSCRLFHAKFGGVPHLVQFENIRPSLDRYKQSNSTDEHFRYDESQFRDWVDSADEMVYAAAQTRFWNDVADLKHEIEKDMLGPVHIQPQSQRYHGPTLPPNRLKYRQTTPITTKYSQRAHNAKA
ncbi:unnamed protein product [Agarophyton chilense]